VRESNDNIITNNQEVVVNFRISHSDAAEMTANGREN
jgi:hypothetical protein